MNRRTRSLLSVIRIACIGREAAIESYSMHETITRIVPLAQDRTGGYTVSIRSS